jgi:hypothetical protein
MGKKRKVVELFSKGATLVHAEGASKNSCGTDKLFKAKLFVQDGGGEGMADKMHAVAFVLPNDLCLLLLPEQLNDRIASCTLEKSMVSNYTVLSGKKKKGAATIAPGARVAIAKTTAGDTIDILCPMRGKLLELNAAIVPAEEEEKEGGASEAGGADEDEKKAAPPTPSATAPSGFQRGYLVVLSPFGDMPPVGTDLDKMSEHRNVCHAWQSGGWCARGDTCIFEHAAKHVKQHEVPTKEM